MFAIDGANRKTPLNYFYRGEECEIIMAHECTGIIEKYFQLATSTESVFFIANYSWYVGDEKALVLAKYFNRLREDYGSRVDLLRRVVILMNSVDEQARMKWFLPDATIVNINNSFTLSEQTFVRDRNDEGEVKYDCVYNAKPLAFKRHYLTTAVENKVFIAYGENGYRADEYFVDLNVLRPRHIAWDIGADKIRQFISESACGLMLSDIEGACYASTEYLLCGSPVVTTKCFGGRDAYYDGQNHIVVPASAAGVAEGVQFFVSKMRNGEIDHNGIRANAIRMQQQYRQKFSETIASMTGMQFEKLKNYVDAAIATDPKLLRRVNYWTKTLSAA